MCGTICHATPLVLPKVELADAISDVKTAATYVASVVEFLYYTKPGGSHEQKERKEQKIMNAAGLCILLHGAVYPSIALCINAYIDHDKS